MILAKQIASRALFLTLLFLMVAEALPRTTEFHNRLDSAIDPLVDVTGFWQDPWELFAPEVDKVRSRISARFFYADGSTREWESPRWSEVSPAGKWRHFREIAFYDRVNRISNDELWPTYAQYLARVEGTREDGSVPEKVELWRHRVSVLPPGSEEGEFGKEQSKRFHTEKMEAQP